MRINVYLTQGAELSFSVAESSVLTSAQTVVWFQDPQKELFKELNSLFVFSLLERALLIT